MRFAFCVRADYMVGLQDMAALRFFFDSRIFCSASRIGAEHARPPIHHSRSGRRSIDSLQQRRIPNGSVLRGRRHPRIGLTLTTGAQEGVVKPFGIYQPSAFSLPEQNGLAGGNRRDRRCWSRHQAKK